MTMATITDSAGTVKQVDARVAQRLIGKRGVSIWGGFVQEEYLTQLASWNKQARLFLEMRDDPTIGALLNAIKLPLLSAEVSVQAASENPADQAAAQFLEANINGMYRQTWRSYADDALECLDFGFAIGEMVLEKRRDGYMWLRNIEPRGQETVRRWIPRSDGSDEIIGFEQAPFRGTDVRGVIDVPLEKCVHIAYRGRKGNPQGRSLLRGIYTPYVFVKNLRTFEGIKIERDVGGTPIVKLPPGINDITSGEFDDLIDQLDGLKTDETLWVTVPDGMEITPYSGTANTTGIRETIRDYQKDMLKVFFAQFLELGMDQAGTQALVKGSHDFFSLALESVQHTLVDAWNQQLVPFLFRFNRFEGMSALPAIAWAPPGKSDLENLLTLYRDGTQAKVLTATRNDEVFLRDIADLPALEDGEGEQDRSPFQHGTLMPLSTMPSRPTSSVPTDLDATALNGAQVTSMLEIVAAVSNNTMPPMAARSLLEAAFPSISRDRIASMIEDAARFVPPPGQKAGDIPDSIAAARRIVARHFDMPDDAGQDLRVGAGIYEKFANNYQRALVDAYDSWATETARLIALNDKTPAQIAQTIDGRLEQLRGDLKLLGRQRIGEASGLGLGGPLGKHAQKPEVQRVIARLIDDNDLYIDESLIPGIRERAMGSVPSLPVDARAKRGAFLEVLSTRRSRIAQGAGGAVTAIFEPQKVAGQIENSERRARGEAPIPVQWVLDDRAEHCNDDGSRGTFGCENLARTYAGGWDDLPTVPAGNTTCLGNCRCQLYADFGNGFERIT